jgi:hypothetical protein
MRSTRRRWLRYSLRSLLALFTVTCLAFGWFASRAAIQRNAVNSLRALGGVVRYDDDGFYEMPTVLARPNRAPVFLPPPKKPWLRQVLGDDWFADVVTVVFYGRAVTDPDLEEALPRLAALPRLRRIEFRTTSITDDGLSPLRSLQQLDYLCLFETPIRIHDQGLVTLRRELPKLRVGY